MHHAYNLKRAHTRASRSDREEAEGADGEALGEIMNQEQEVRGPRITAETTRERLGQGRDHVAMAVALGKPGGELLIC